MVELEANKHAQTHTEIRTVSFICPATGYSAGVNHLHQIWTRELH